MTAPPDADALAAAAESGLRELQRAAEALGSWTVESRSDDGTLTAVVTLHARTTELIVRPDALRTYDSGSLGEATAATIRAAQRKA